jgi:hypothetical protein
MELKVYKNGWGQEVKIMGLAKTEKLEEQTIYWSLQGDWYAEDGRFVGYGEKCGYRLLPASSWRTLII